MQSPYIGLPKRAYWRSGVTERHPMQPGDIYRRKFALLPSHRIATAGSCFAQHIARRLRISGYQVIDEEPAPPGMPTGVANDFGYGLYSARYGNIYTTRQLWQLAQEAFGSWQPVDAVWDKKGRFFDALRPSVEPDGLASAEIVREHRAAHLRHVRAVLTKATVVVFTFGLTEAWVHRASGTTYPTAPGTIAGSFDPAVVGFKNFDYPEVLADFLSFRDLMRGITPDIRFLLTVSPVPLTATASPEHVLPATIYSKSVLRAVAGYLAATHDDIDYFPSYEIVAGMPSRGMFYETNLRSVAEAGVDVVMRSFFEQHPPLAAKPAEPARGPLSAQDAEAEQQKVICEEAMLEAFAR